MLETAISNHSTGGVVNFIVFNNIQLLPDYKMHR